MGGPGKQLMITLLIAAILIQNCSEALIWCESCNSPHECRKGQISNIRCFHSNSCLIRFSPSNPNEIAKKGCGGLQYNSHCQAFMMPGIQKPVTECYCGPYDLCNGAGRLSAFDNGGRMVLIGSVFASVLLAL